jgi:heme-degrading monooxygenase HmoA
MYAVIFKARIAELDDEYHQVAKRMRQLAIEKYGCRGFSSVTEGDEEIAISYWQNEGQIIAWKSDPEHIQAQEKGKSKWYRSYQVQVVKVMRDYTSNT